jgi:ornithine cyclodeaminase/alanine dehydrogenase
VALYLTEEDVAGLIAPAEAVPVLEACLARLAAGGVGNMPRGRLPLPGGALDVTAAADAVAGLAGVAAFAGSGAALCLFAVEDGSLAAVVEAGRLRQLRAAAASGVAAAQLAREGAASIGVIGCGRHAEAQLAAIRASVPAPGRALAWCRTPERVRDFCTRTGAEPADGARDAAACDVVVTATTSRDPVLRGDWLRPGALVCAAGATHPSRRELDTVTLERATFVCCDSLEQARTESADLFEPVASGVLDWLEVHELQDVAAGTVRGRSADTDITVFTSSGIAAWDVAIGAEIVARARERGAGRDV